MNKAFKASHSGTFELPAESFIHYALYRQSQFRLPVLGTTQKWRV